MDSIQPFLETLKTVAGSADFWWQFIVVAVAIIVGLITNKTYQKKLDSHVGDLAHGLKEISVRLLGRILLPVSILLVLFIGNILLGLLEVPDQVLGYAIPLLSAMAIVRASVYILHRTFRPTKGLRAWETVISTFVWIVFALHLLGWLPEVTLALDSIAVKVGDNRISLYSGIKLIIYGGIFLVLALTASRIIERQISKAEYLSPGFKVGATKFSKVAIITFSLIVSLTSVGIDLTALTVFGGALGVGVGFGLQRIASNFISGFIVVLDRSIKPGDVITVGGTYGWVQELRARYIVVRDRSGVERLIPNENLITSEVINWSYSDRKVRIKIPIQISYSNDPEMAMCLMEDAANSVSRVLTEPPPGARLVNFGESGIDLELRVWIADPQSGVTNVKSAVNRGIWKNFKENNIEIPFPQRVVHVTNDQTL
ncbi:MAG: mechanosensitive ion channel family protein [bacterium]